MALPAGRWPQLPRDGNPYNLAALFGGGNANLKVSVSKVCAATSLFLGGSAFASGMGQPMQLVMQNGVPRIGAQYSHEPRQVTLVLAGTFLTSSLPTKRPIYFRMLNSVTGSFTSEWVDLGLSSAPSSQDSFSIALDRKAALQTLKAFPHVIVLFSRDGQGNDACLELKSICNSFPGTFVDQTRVKAGCEPDKAIRLCRKRLADYAVLSFTNATAQAHMTAFAAQSPGNINAYLSVNRTLPFKAKRWVIFAISLAQ